MLEGILNIDKPAGMTSHDVVARVRRAAGMRRVGHSGTLDPMATGVLVVCLGRATRLVEYLVGRPKTYFGTVRLGQTTDSYDADGKILSEKEVPELTADIIESLLEQFRGDILQIPPMVSAIKKDGKKLYELAREGKTVDRPPRPVTIYQLDLLKVESPEITLRIQCSAGTYIRSIAYDLGELLGCGGHLSSLRREQVGEFGLDTAVPLDSLTAENINLHLQRPELAVSHLPKLDVSFENEINLLNGKLVARDNEYENGTLMQTYNPSGRFIGLVTAHGDFWKAKKMFQA
ncbi:MAG: tRNA pseudouridine(55) synthase TruB [Anaerolineae bacterium]